MIQQLEINSKLTGQNLFKTMISPLGSISLLDCRQSTTMDRAGSHEFAWKRTFWNHLHNKDVRYDCTGKFSSVSFKQNIATPNFLIYRGKKGKTKNEKNVRFKKMQPYKKIQPPKIHRQQASLLSQRLHFLSQVTGQAPSSLG